MVQAGPPQADALRMACVIGIFSCACEVNCALRR